MPGASTNWSRARTAWVRRTRREGGRGLRASWQEVSTREQRRQRGLLDDGIAAAFEAVDDRDRVQDLEPREPRALDRLERRGAGRHDVLEDHDLRARREPGAL